MRDSMRDLIDEAGPHQWKRVWINMRLSLIFLMRDLIRDWIFLRLSLIVLCITKYLWGRASLIWIFQQYWHNLADKLTSAKGFFLVALIWGAYYTPTVKFERHHSWSLSNWNATTQLTDKRVRQGLTPAPVVRQSLEPAPPLEAEPRTTTRCEAGPRTGATTRGRASHHHLLWGRASNQQPTANSKKATTTTTINTAWWQQTTKSTKQHIK